MIILKLNGFEIKIYEDKFDWYVQFSSHPITCGHGTSINDAREQALRWLENYLNQVKKELKIAKMKKYTTVPLHAFRWFPGGTFTLQSSGSYWLFHDQIVHEGDWIFPEQHVVMHNNAFQKLFKRV